MLRKQFFVHKRLNAEQSFAKATDSKRRKTFIIRELLIIDLIFYLPYYQDSRKV
jgi:hypothetical protein